MEELQLILKKLDEIQAEQQDMKAEMQAFKEALQNNLDERIDELHNTVDFLEVTSVKHSADILKLRQKIADWAEHSSKPSASVQKDS